MHEPHLLERITLERRAILFGRAQGSGARFYHWHQCAEFLFISKGYGLVVMDNQQFTLRPGRLFVFPPFRLHKVQVDERGSDLYYRTTMHIDQTQVAGHLRPFPRFHARFARLTASDAPAQAYDLRDQQDFMETVLRQFSALAADYPAEEAAFLVMQILSVLPAQPLEIKAQQRTLSAQIMQWIEANYAGKFSLDALARDIGLSRSYTSRIFRQQTGGSIHEYLLTRRLKRGCDLLRTTDLSVDAVAEKVGFSDATYFITCFKKMMQQTPLQYRKKTVSF